MRWWVSCRTPQPQMPACPTRRHRTDPGCHMAPAPWNPLHSIGLPRTRSCTGVTSGRASRRSGQQGMGSAHHRHSRSLLHTQPGWSAGLPSCHRSCSSRAPQPAAPASYYPGSTTPAHRTRRTSMPRACPKSGRHCKAGTCWRGVASTCRVCSGCQRQCVVNQGTRSRQDSLCQHTTRAVQCTVSV